MDKILKMVPQGDGVYAVHLDEKIKPNATKTIYIDNKEAEKLAGSALQPKEDRIEHVGMTVSF